MAKKKYDKNFIRGPFFENLGGGYTGTSVWAHHNEYNMGVSFGYHCIANTDFDHLEPHTHDFDELLMFFGGNPRDIRDFGAEVSFCLGEEMEEHIITSPTVVCIPAGMVHCPLKVNRCDKPIVMVEVSTTKEYVIVDLPEDKKPKAAESGTEEAKPGKKKNE